MKFTERTCFRGRKSRGGWSHPIISEGGGIVSLILSPNGDGWIAPLNISVYPLKILSITDVNLYKAFLGSKPPPPTFWEFRLVTGKGVGVGPPIFHPSIYACACEEMRLLRFPSSVQAYFNRETLGLIRNFISGGDTRRLEYILAEGSGLIGGQHNQDAAFDSNATRGRCRVSLLPLNTGILAGLLVGWF